MSDIVEWLLEQVAADENLIRDATGVRVDTTSVELTLMLTAFNPARLLAECKAKREIVSLHESRGNSTCSCEDRFPCWTLCQFAQPYADRPGYDPEWSTE